MNDLFFPAKIAKMGNKKLVIIVPKSLHHLFPGGTKVKVVKARNYEKREKQ